MTANLNESMNENLKEFQSIFMKTVEEMIAKQMSMINLNMVQTIQNTLIRQPPQDTTQENHQSPNNIGQSLTQLSTPANTNATTTITIENQSPNESTTITSNGNAKRKQNDQLCPEETQDTISDDNNDTFMEDQSSITLHNQKNQTILSTPNRRDLRKKSSNDSLKTLSRLGRTRK